MILNYGKIYRPVLSDVVDMSQYLAPRSQALCDTDCVAEECVDLERLAKGRSPIRSNQCLRDCGCELKIDNLNYQEVQNIENTQRSLQGNVASAQEHLQGAVGTQVPALQQRAQELQEAQEANRQDFADFVRGVVGNLADCDTHCVDDCVDSQWVNYFEVPQCLKYCQC